MDGERDGWMDGWMDGRTEGMARVREQGLRGREGWREGLARGADGSMECNGERDRMRGMSRDVKGC